MQLAIEDCDTLILTPETEAERERLVALFGPMDGEEPALPSPLFGKAITLGPEGAVRVGLGRAWWNFDPW